MGMFLTGCESDSLVPEKGSEKVNVRLDAPAFVHDDASGISMSAVTSVYVFSQGILSSSFDVNPGETADFTTMSDNMVYAVAGVEMPAVAVGEPIEKLTLFTVSSPDGGASAQDFYAGVGKVSSSADGMEVEMRHGVARIDIACKDPKIVISEVIVENAPAASYVLPSEHVLSDAPTVSYRKEVGEDFSGLIEEAFTVYESAHPVTLRVNGTYDGDRMSFTGKLPIVERNKVYTFGVTGGASLEGTITVSDWENGDTGEGLVMLGETAIDLEHSLIPPGVTVDRNDNTLTLPPSGVEGMKIAFLTSQPLSIKRVTGASDRISFVAAGSENVGKGVLTTFLVSAPAQPKFAYSYSATVVLEGTSTFFLNLIMSESDITVPTVRMAGSDWMCFNAVSDKMDDQIIVPAGMSVEQMYNEHFEECVGNYFQYGRLAGYNPFLSYNFDEIGNLTRNIPWNTTGKMPLPQGYHVATAAEWSALTPPDGNLPARYTSNGDSIHASVVTLEGTLLTPSANINSQNYRKRYLLFESVTTGNKLFIPFIGLKEPKTVELPSQSGSYRFETRSGYWIMEDRYFWLIDYKDRGEGVDGAYMKQDRWDYNGFIGVRGVKD